MANIVGLNDNNLLSSTSVYDANAGTTQSEINKVKTEAYEPIQGISILDFVNTLRYTTGGKMGSVYLNAAPKTSMPATWYNYIWIPHRVGGNNIDNYNYGTLLMFPMVSTLTYACYKIQVTNGKIETYHGISGTLL